MEYTVSGLSVTLAFFFPTLLALKLKVEGLGLKA